MDTTVQEKAITYPTDSKLLIKIINRLKVCRTMKLRQEKVGSEAGFSIFWDVMVAPIARKKMVWKKWLEKDRETRSKWRFRTGNNIIRQALIH